MAKRYKQAGKELKVVTVAEVDNVIGGTNFALEAIKASYDRHGKLVEMIRNELPDYEFNTRKLAEREGRRFVRNVRNGWRFIPQIAQSF